MPKAATYDIDIQQGSDFGFGFTYKENGSPKDLTGYSLRGQIRKKATDDDVLGTFTCVFTDAANGTATVSMPNADTAALTPGRAVYDIEMYTAADAYVGRILEGKVEITAEVTR